MTIKLLASVWLLLLVLAAFAAGDEAAAINVEDVEGVHAESGGAAEEEEQLDLPEAPLYTTPTVPDSALLVETFDSSPLDGRWTVSDDEEYGNAVWQHAAGILQGDSSLSVGKEAARYGIGIQLPKAAGVGGSSGNDELVLQYEVHTTEGLSCGGAYLKFLPADDGFSPAALSPSTRYSIMFGPDRCGATNKVHFIFQFQNPVTEEWVEHHLRAAPAPPADERPHVYTLVLREDSSFAIYIDLEEVKAGSLLADFEPAVNPAAEIDDPEDSKPDDWVDDKEIDDPEASKPDDWDESQPRTLPDMEAEKPEGWLDDAPAYVADPSAEQPEDWDEEEDGEYEAPLIPNPACEEAPGCGKWERPTISNPLFKGKWKAPRIPNPAYKGEWAPRRIANPAFFEEDAPATKLAAIGSVAIEIWTMDKGIQFDNVIVATSLADALQFGEAAWRAKADYGAEVQAIKNEAIKRRMRQRMKESGVAGMVQYYIAEAGDLVQAFPILAAGLVVLALVGLIVCCRNTFKDSPPPAAVIAEGEDEEDDDDDEDDIVAEEKKEDAEDKKEAEEKEEDEADVVEETIASPKKGKKGKKNLRKRGKRTED